MTVRVLVEPGSLDDGARVDLDASESHHLKVRRIGDGAPVTACDGAGRFAPGTIVAHGAEFGVSVDQVQLAPERAPTVLAVGAGDKDRFLLLAERCTELNVARLIPLETSRSRTVESRVRNSSLVRARRRSREACKQSGNPWATVIDDICELSALSGRWPGARWLIAAPDGGSCPKLDPSGVVGWIIGPEGGLEPAELAFCSSSLGAIEISLGAVLLRFDTAAIAAAVTTQLRRNPA